MKARIQKIAYVSGSRADFGLMTQILESIATCGYFKLQIYATGMQLMEEFGSGIELIKNQFPSVKILPATFFSDKREAMVRFSAELLNQIIAAFTRDRPDFVLILGDRVEMLTTSLACLYLGIPTGQFHAGDRTLTVDDSARHAITKMSNLLFPATQEAVQRLRKMGEESWRIHLVGAPSLDAIKMNKLPGKSHVYDFLHLPLNQKYILLIQHPVSEELKDARRQMQTTLAAVKNFNLPVVVITSNADAGGRQMISAVKQEQKNPLFRIFLNVAYNLFLGIERETSVFVGNSSAAMIESSSFKIPVVNIGTRQLGRQHGANVINAPYNKAQISKAIDFSLNNKTHLLRLTKIRNPWGDGKCSGRVIKILCSLKLDKKLMAKQISY